MHTCGLTSACSRLPIADARSSLPLPSAADAQRWAAKPMQYAIVLLFLLTAASADAWQFAGEAPPQEIARWAEFGAPDEWSNSLFMCANHGFGGEWHVGAESGRVVVQEYQQRLEVSLPLPETAYASLGDAARGARSYLKVDDGYLVGFNAGEWGGSVWWLSSDGSSNDRLSETWGAGGNPVAFFPAGEEVLLVSGLAHLGLREGSIKYIRRGDDGRWRIVRETPLGTAAEVAIKHPTLGILIVATDRILSYRGGELQVLQRIELGGLYPNSIALGSDDEVYVGMRYVVARLTPSERTVQATWFVPPTCRTLAKKLGSSGCTCKQ